MSEISILIKMKPEDQIKIFNVLSLYGFKMILGVPHHDDKDNMYVSYLMVNDLDDTKLQFLIKLLNLKQLYDKRGKIRDFYSYNLG